MFSESTELYDLIYGSLKNYPAEAAQIARLIERERPGARSVLDVACGTGEHIRHLQRLGNYQITGIDIQPAFVSIAQEKNPDAHIVCADMMSFDLSSRFDVVLCLFSSIGYARTADNVKRALAQFRDHVTTDGVIIVEPWFVPSVWKSGYVSNNTAQNDELKVCRMSRSDVRGNLSIVEFEYLIGRAAGIEHRRELHEMGLFTVAEMLACFEAADLAVQYDEQGLTGRGLYIATRR